MAEDLGMTTRDANLIHILVEKLVLTDTCDVNFTFDDEHGESHKETVALPHDAPLSALWDKLHGLF
jgi:hypothetical protein